MTPENTYDLEKLNSHSSLKKVGCIIINIRLQSTSPSALPPAQDPSISPNLSEPQNEHLVISAAEDASHSVAKISSPAILPASGNIVTSVTNITASDSFSLVLGCIEKVISFGDILTEVRVYLRAGCIGLSTTNPSLLSVVQIHPYAKLAWMALTSIPKVCPINLYFRCHYLIFWLNNRCVGSIDPARS